MNGALQRIGDPLRRGLDQLGELGDDPLGTLTKDFSRWGIVLLLGGVASYVVGYQFRRWGAKADADMSAIIGGIGATFANAEAASRSVAGLVNALAMVASESYHYAPLDGAVTVSVLASSPDGAGQAPSLSGHTVTVSITDGSGNVVTGPHGTRWSNVPLTYQSAPPPFGVPMYSGPTTGLADGTTYIVTVTIDGVSYAYTNAYMHSRGVFIVGTVSPAGGWLPDYADPSRPMTYTEITGSSSQASGNQSVALPPPSTALGTLAGDIAGAAVGASDLPHAILMVGTSLPRLTVDAAGSLVGDAGTVMEEGGILFGVIGGILLVSSYVLRRYGPGVEVRLEAAISRITGPVESPEIRRDAAIVVASNSGSEELREIASGSTTSPQPPIPPEPLTTPPEPAVATPPEEPISTPDRPLPMGTPTSEIEDHLGSRAIEPSGEELRRMEEARLASMPGPIPPVRPQEHPDRPPWHDDEEEGTEETGYDVMRRAEIAFSES